MSTLIPFGKAFVGDRVAAFAAEHGRPAAYRASAERRVHFAFAATWLQGQWVASGSSGQRDPSRPPWKPAGGVREPEDSEEAPPDDDERRVGRRRTPGEGRIEAR